MPVSKNRRKNGKKSKKTNPFRLKDQAFISIRGRGDTIYLGSDVKSTTPFNDLVEHLRDFPLYYEDSFPDFRALANYVFDKTPLIIAAWEFLGEADKGNDLLMIRCHNGRQTKTPRGAGAELLPMPKKLLVSMMGDSDAMSKSLTDPIPSGYFACIVTDSFGNFETHYLGRPHQDPS